MERGKLWLYLIVLLTFILLSGCASVQTTEENKTIMDDTIMALIGDEENIKKYQYYVSSEIELAKINNGQENTKIELIMINQQTKGMVIGNKQDEGGNKIIEISFGSDDEKINFYREADKAGRYYLAHTSGEVIKYGDNEYKITYHYTGAERPYLFIDINRNVNIAKGRSK